MKLEYVYVYFHVAKQECSFDLLRPDKLKSDRSLLQMLLTDSQKQPYCSTCLTKCLEHETKRSEFVNNGLEFLWPEHLCIFKRLSCFKFGLRHTMCKQDLVVPFLKNSRMKC